MVPESTTKETPASPGVLETVLGMPSHIAGVQSILLIGLIGCYAAIFVDIYFRILV